MLKNFDFKPTNDEEKATSKFSNPHSNLLDTGCSILSECYLEMYIYFFRKSTIYKNHWAKSTVFLPAKLPAALIPAIMPPIIHVSAINCS